MRRALASLAGRGMPVETIPTTGRGTATGIARNAIERGADLILVAGGDGTINEVVNGMVHSEVPLGILPAGTANVLATELGAGKTMEQAAEALLDCTEERIALGLLSTQAPLTDVRGSVESVRYRAATGGSGFDHELRDAPRYFLLMAGVGLDAEIVYDLNLRLKDMLGKAAYWIAGFRKLGRRLPEFTVEVEGQVFRAGFALVSRVRNYGGDLEIAPAISLFEDEFEIVLFEGENSFRYLKYMFGVGTGRHRGMRGVTILRARSCNFPVPADPRVHIQVDGEYVGTLPAKVEIVPRALTLLVPPSFRASRLGSAQRAQWTTSPTR
jgi:diacylglycerol kinase (ATP)